jgi:hypothetical protein
MTAGRRLGLLAVIAALAACQPASPPTDPAGPVTPAAAPTSAPPAPLEDPGLTPIASLPEPCQAFVREHQACVARSPDPVRAERLGRALLGSRQIWEMAAPADRTERCATSMSRWRLRRHSEGC